MSYINGKFAQEWIEENHPENGWFRAYWTEDGALAELSPDHLVEPQISLEDCGLGIRYQWEYKDGKRADGISRGWWYRGNIKHERTHKDGKLNGFFARWYENGNKEEEGNFKNDEHDGKWTWYHTDGQKHKEETYKDGKVRK